MILMISGDNIIIKAMNKLIDLLDLEYGELKIIVHEKKAMRYIISNQDKIIYDDDQD